MALHAMHTQYRKRRVWYDCAPHVRPVGLPYKQPAASHRHARRVTNPPSLQLPTSSQWPSSSLFAPILQVLLFP
jgi:hypothetical protein